MSDGQGAITFGGPEGGSGGGGGFPAVGALNGLSIELVGGIPYVMLGNASTDVTDPAAILNNRRIQMNSNSLDLGITGLPGWFLEINNTSEGAGPNEIPVAFLSPQASYWEMWQPSNYGTTYTPGGTANRWRSGYDVYPGVNPGTTRPNVVGMWWGYNTNFQQGRVDATEAAFRYATETYFEIGGDPHFEFHTPEITTDGGSIFRLDSTYVSRVTGIGFREIVMNDVQWFDTTHNPSGGLYYLHYDYTVSSDTMKMDLRSQLTDGVTQITIGNYTDGLASFTYQGTLFNINNSGAIAMVALDLTIHTTLGVVTGPITFATDDFSHLATGDAVLEAYSITKGFRPPAMTTTQKNAMSIFGGGGIVVYDTTLNKLSLWTGSAWQTVQSI